MYLEARQLAFDVTWSRPLSAGPGSVEEVFCQTFTAGVPGIGEVRMEPLIPGGEDIFVTEANRREYVDAYVDFYLNRSVQRQFEVVFCVLHVASHRKLRP